MVVTLDATDHALLDGWQRDFPLVPKPFTEIARRLGISEAEVLDRLRCLMAAGAVSRIGATLRPNTAGASTLAAMAVPDLEIEQVANIVNAESGVNHSYLRENQWNLWFVVTGPDRDHVDATLARLRKRTGLTILDLRLVRPFNISLAFPLDGPGRLPPDRTEVDAGALQAGDRDIMQALSTGLALVPKPFSDLGQELDRPEDEIIDRIGALAAAGILSRIGVIVRHRALGWRSNAMVVWDLPAERAEEIGPRLAQIKGVTLCYQRRAIPGVWPYTLYCMIHARSRAEALGVLDNACDELEIGSVPHQVLFSIRCFKQMGALVAAPNGAAA